MPSLRSRPTGVSPRSSREARDIHVHSPPTSGGTLKGHSEHHHEKARRRSSLMGAQMIAKILLMMFLAWIIGGFVALFFMHHQHLDDNSSGSSGGGQDAGLANVVSSSLLTSASMEQVRQAAAKIHDEAFKKLLGELHHEKEEYKHLLKPKKSIFQKYDKKSKTKLQDTVKRDKKGEIVYKPITKISIEDLGKLGVANAKEVAADMTYEQAIQGRERLVEIIHEAGIEDIDIPSILSLPTWDSVSKLYGDGPVVIGLERCQEFRTNEAKFPTWDASLGTAGLFNTGTNPFAMYLEQNCKMPLNKSDKHGGTR